MMGSAGDEGQAVEGVLSEAMLSLDDSITFASSASCFKGKQGEHSSIKSKEGAVTS